MKKYAMAATALATAASMANAGGIERRGDPSMILFEKSRVYLEFSASSIDPQVSGSPLAGVPTAPTGDIQERYQSFAGGLKYQLNDKIALALVIDEPVGASVNYQLPTVAGGGAFFGGSNAELNTIAFTGMAKYQASERFSVYGGLRYIGLGGSVFVISPATGPTLTGPGAPYSLNEDKDFQFGYLLGAAYEIPDIALRVALTYESKTEHDFDDNTGAGFEVKIPQAFTLHAQTGIAANTLLFGSVKWREWTDFRIQPADFSSVAPGVGFVNTAIASEPEDIWTYELGIGRRFTENWSGAFILGYEKDEGQPVGNLSGKDGYISYGLAATYENEHIKVTTGIRYFDIGNANSSVTSFTNNDAFAFGTKVGFKF
ncbi:Outer membrane protein transport protein (OMPP1/FadL/TodX) [Roseovarius litorisediminis]|uniref:Outer membrane protein transport protein (OMPP1/FadL/TodX) n=1 Tax=Roseovarius litorisediminis TaxID=1312363 RepID=A0A1Y5RBR2_9RHOB|nr:outer membrane protein transport protein [Roseovarius litorisediminis]SLN12570.1 Outer membrane protein transport protein (OMPP1/FadL/TodX) [Roseovarius litorisediminis]